MKLRIFFPKFAIRPLPPPSPTIKHKGLLGVEHIFQDEALSVVEVYTKSFHSLFLLKIWENLMSV